LLKKQHRWIGVNKMNNRIFLEHLVETHHRELLQEAQSWRELSLAMGKKPAKVGLIQRIRTQVGKLALGPTIITGEIKTREA
jgi:hypothetical protein